MFQHKAASPMKLYFLFLSFSLVPFAIANSNADAQNATVFSLVYGYPLLAWQNIFSPIVQDIGANTWHHARELSTPANRTVVKPNVDTLYSQVIYDLSQSDLEIAVPDVPTTNFKLFSFYDPYGDDYADFGTGGFFQSGTYLVTPLERSNGGAVGLQVLNGSYQVGTVTSPSAYGVLLVRWGLNQTDVDTVHQWQGQCSSQMMAASKNLTGVTMPKLDSLISVYNTSASPAENVMNMLPHYLPPNAPAAQFEAAGISVSKATYTPQSSVNLTLANVTAVAMVAEAVVDPSVQVVENNGWGVLSPTLIGTYGTDYALRTVIADSGYLALKNPYAVYPTWTNASQSNATAALSLGPREGILFTFSGKPPLQEAGFWSLTAYGGDYFLIPNAIDVYAIGDRSNITYPDGSRVYYGSASNSGCDMRDPRHY